MTNYKKFIFSSKIKGGLNRQVVVLDRWSLKQVPLYLKLDLWQMTSGDKAMVLACYISHIYPNTPECYTLLLEDKVGLLGILVLVVWFVIHDSYKYIPLALKSSYIVTLDLKVKSFFLLLMA